MTPRTFAPIMEYDGIQDGAHQFHDPNHGSYTVCLQIIPPGLQPGQRVTLGLCVIDHKYTVWRIADVNAAGSNHQQTANAVQPGAERGREPARAEAPLAQGGAAVQAYQMELI